tara:strand:+ start:225 stop:791 length:567 start_codon:yes stop_codon:yes gene_type:complete
MPNFKKTKGFNLRSGNKPNMSSFKMMGSTTPSPITSPYKQKEITPEMQAKSAKNDPRYGEMSFEEYKKDVQRQVKSNKETGSYNANNTDKKVEKKDTDAKETNVTETAADGITESVTNEGTPKVNKFMSAASKVKGGLVSGFTGGLDAVYGTGQVLADGQVVFSKKKKKEEDSETGEQKVNKIINKPS